MNYVCDCYSVLQLLVLSSEVSTVQHTKYAVLRIILELAGQLSELYEGLPSFTEIFTPLSTNIQRYKYTDFIKTMPRLLYVASMVLMLPWELLRFAYMCRKYHVVCFLIHSSFLV